MGQKKASISSTLSSHKVVSLYLRRAESSSTLMRCHLSLRVNACQARGEEGEGVSSVFEGASSTAGLVPEYIFPGDTLPLVGAAPPVKLFFKDDGIGMTVSKLPQFLLWLQNKGKLMQNNFEAPVWLL